jgi:phosphoglycerol transferase MdoB-like AlkP superfamily enzyme
MTLLLTTFLITLGLSFIPERFLKARYETQQSLIRSFFKFDTGCILHLFVISLVYLTAVLILHRPVFAALVTLITFTVFIIVSNAKYKTLREPLVFSDIAMFSQAFKHPRLYLPFLGIVPVIALPVFAITAIYLLLRLEPAITFSPAGYLIIISSLVIILLWIKKLALRVTNTLEPEQDIKAHGLIATLVSYSLQANTAEHKAKIQQAIQASFWNTDIDFRNKTKPDIITIQSESFFDARRLSDIIKPDILSGYDLCKEDAIMHGQLNVPAWGANTMRTEFSFLTGIPNDKLGYYRFYPYQYLYKTKIPSIASYLQSTGYYCVCIHPHPEGFFGRDKIFPQMGFDEFIDIRSFDAQRKFGPYISDEAVTDKILDTLKQHDKPVFIFAITMENHGPLHLEKATQQDEKALYTTKPPEKTNDLTIYLRHLKNADRMITALTQTLPQTLKYKEKDFVLCFYGDHIPSMPGIYEITDYKDDKSDFIIWKSKPDSAIRSNKTTTEAHELAKAIFNP